jgi:hypothetical protein
VIRPAELWGDGHSLKKRRPYIRPPKLNPDGTEATPKKRKRAKKDGLDADGDQDGSAQVGEQEGQQGPGSAGDVEMRDQDAARSGVDAQAGDVRGTDGDEAIDPTLDDTFEGIDDGHMASMLGISASDGL